MDESPETEKLSALFANLGASESAARTMAEQLLKRAEQLAKERSVSRMEALDYLLKVAIAGREGRVYDGKRPGSGITKRD